MGETPKIFKPKKPKQKPLQPSITLAQHKTSSCNSDSDKNNTFYCPLCLASYNSKNEFARHKISHKHKHLLALQKGEPNGCQICGKASLLEIKCHCDDYC